MPTNLNNLRVSLTKHGAHKVAYLLESFDPNDIVNHIAGDFNDINIELAQTRGNLSISKDDQIPKIWTEIKKYKREDIFDLTFLAIVFSHRDLIISMKEAFLQKCKVVKGQVISGKAYTNFAHTLDELGYSIEHTSAFITFDISRIFYKFYLTPLISELLKIKLLEAGWEMKNTIIEECLSLELNQSVGLSEATFNSWLTNESEDSIIPISKAKRNFYEGIKFIEGHNEKMEDDLIIMPLREKQKITLLHNKIQNRLYQFLKRQFPQDQIGTEVFSSGGSIDIVKRGDDNSFVFYEIKTTQNCRSNIRQALPQLLEYAYWKPNMKVNKLIIVGPCKINSKSESYLKYLRANFNINIYYQFFDLKAESLGEEK